MKKKLFNGIFITAFVCSILYGAGVNADEIIDENSDISDQSLTFEATSQDIKQYLKNKGKVLFVAGLMKNRIMVWSGFHNYLYGYEDQRYAGTNSGSKDQGDYIKTDSQYYGIELFFSDAV